MNISVRDDSSVTVMNPSAYLLSPFHPTEKRRCESTSLIEGCYYHSAGGFTISIGEGTKIDDMTFFPCLTFDTRTWYPSAMVTPTSASVRTLLEQYRKEWYDVHIEAITILTSLTNQVLKNFIVEHRVLTKVCQAEHKEILFALIPDALLERCTTPTRLQQLRYNAYKIAMEELREAHPDTSEPVLREKARECLVLMGF